MKASLISVTRGARLATLAAVTNRAPLGGTLGWFLVVAAVYASDAGPPLPAMAVTAAALFPAAAWVTTAMLASLSNDLRAVLTASCGRTRALFMDLCAPVLWVVIVAGVGVAVCWVFDPHVPTARQVAAGAGLHLLCGSCGVAFGLLAHAGRLTPGTTTLAIAGTTVVSLVVRQFPPIGPELVAWGGYKHRTASHAVWPIVGALLLSFALLAWAAVVRRRRA